MAQGTGTLPGEKQQPGDYLSTNTYYQTPGGGFSAAQASGAPNPQTASSQAMQFYQQQQAQAQAAAQAAANKADPGATRSVQPAPSSSPIFTTPPDLQGLSAPSAPVGQTQVPLLPGQQASPLLTPTPTGQVQQFPAGSTRQKLQNTLNPTGVRDEAGNVISTASNTLNAQELLLLGMQGSSSIGMGAVQELKALASTIEDGLSLVRNPTMTSTKIGKVASGFSPNTYTSDTYGNVILNTKTAQLESSFLQKIIPNKSTYWIVLGALGQYLYSTPESFKLTGDAVTSLTIAHALALKENDQQGADALYAAMQDLKNTATIVKNLTPIINLPLAAYKKTEAGALVMQVAHDRAARQAAGQAAGEPTKQEQDAAYYDKIAQDRQTQRDQQRQQDETYYNQIAQNITIAHQQARAADEAYWTGIQEKNQAAAEAKRKEDQAFYDALAAKKATAQAQDHAYWMQQLKLKEATQKSHLTFGLLQ